MSSIWDEAELVSEEPKKDIWAEAEEVQQPQPQPKNVVPNRPANQELKVEEPTQDVKSDFQLNATKNYTQEMGADGRTYLVDENGNRVVNNDLSGIEKFKRKGQAFLSNLGDYINAAPDTEQWKDKAKKLAFAESMFLPGSVGAKGALGWALGGGLGAGTLTAGENLIDEGKINPVQTTANAIIGALSGGTLYGAGKGLQALYNNPTVRKVAKTAVEELVPGVRRYNINKHKATPLADRMTPEQLERATTPDVVSDYGVANIDSARNKAIAEQMQANIETENALMNEYKTLHSDAVKKYGSIENLKAQAVKDLENEVNYGEVSEALRDYRNLLDYEKTLQDAKYVSTNIKGSATRENPIVQNVDNNIKVKTNQPVAKSQPQAIVPQTQRIVQPPVQQQPKGALPKGKKYRSFGDERYGKEINEATTDKVYDVYSHEAQANNWLSKSAEEQQQLLNDVDNIAPEVMYGKAEAVKDAIAKGEPLPTKMLNGVAKNLTTAGQEIEAAKHFMPTTPEGIALDITKQARKEAAKSAVKIIDNADSIANELNNIKVPNKQKAIEQILKKHGVAAGKMSKASGLIKDLAKLKDLDALTGENLIELVQNKYKIPTIKPEDYAKMDELSKNFVNATTDRERQIATGKIKKFVANKGIKDIGTMEKTWRTINMLFTPVGRSADALFTGQFQGIRAIDDLIAKGISGITKSGTRSGIETLNPVKWAKNVAKGAKNAAEDVKLGINTPRSWETDRYDLGIIPQFENTPILGAMEKGLRYGIEVPDRAWSNGVYEAVKEDLKRTGNFTDEEIEKIAGQEALAGVYQDDNWLAKVGSEVLRKANDIGKEYDALKWLNLGHRNLPFFRTITNLGGDVLGRLSGYDIVAGGIKRALADTLAQKRAAENQLAKGITGQGLLALGGLIGNNTINNIGQINPVDTYGDDVTGLAPQSVVVGDKAISLSNNPLIASAIGVGKEIYGDKPMTEKAMKAAANLGAIIQDFPAIKNIGSMVKGGTDTQDILAKGNVEKGLQKTNEIGSPYIANLINQEIPIKTLLGQTRTAIDPYNREVYDTNMAKYIGNLIMNGLPGLSQNLPMKYNALGEPSMRTNIENPVARFIEATASPVKIRNYNPSKIRDDLKNYQDIVQDLPEMEDVKGKSNIELKKLPRAITVNGEKLKLNNEQYSEAQKLYGQLQTKYKQEIFDKNLPPKKKVELLAEARKSAEEAIKINLFDHKPKKGRSKYTNRMIDDIKNGDL